MIILLLVFLGLVAAGVWVAAKPLRPSTITAYVGVNGSGKTLSAIAFAVQDFRATGRPLVTNVTGISVEHFHVEGVEELSELLEALSRCPEWYPPRTVRTIFGERQRTPLKPGSCNIVLDEAGAMFASRDTGRNKAFEKVVQQLRKFDARLLWTAPAFARADKILREVTFKVILCMPLRQKRIPGRAWASTRLAMQKSFDVSRLDSSGMSINKNAKARGFGIIRTAPWESAFDSFARAGLEGYDREAGMALVTSAFRASVEDAVYGPGAGPTAFSDEAA